MAGKQKERRTLRQEVGKAFSPIIQGLRRSGRTPRVGPGQPPLAFAVVSVPPVVARSTNRLRKKIDIAGIRRRKRRGRR